MEIEKTVSVAAPAQQVWAMLLDPNVMGGCVPGMQSIEVLSEDEYIALMHVKISFISAKFKLKTRIVERRAPYYLRTEGTGEDTSVASSLTQQSEIFLSEQPGGQTELRIKVLVDVVGRLGTFGLNVMKTKADRMWDEFARNLATRLAPEALQTLEPTATAVAAPSTQAAAPVMQELAHGAVAPGSVVAGVRVEGLPASAGAVQTRSWWWRLLRRRPGVAAGGRCIHVEIQRGDTRIAVDWPLEGASECAAWLLDVQDER